MSDQVSTNERWQTFGYEEKDWWEDETQENGHQCDEAVWTLWQLCSTTTAEQECLFGHVTDSGGFASRSSYMRRHFNAGHSCSPGMSQIGKHLYEPQHAH